MSESNQLTDLPPERVVDAVQVLVRLRRTLERVETGLSLPQYQLLSMVRSGGERSARLADRLAVRKPTLTAAADALVAAGFLEREADPGDRRVVRVRITPAGLGALRSTEEQLAEAVAPLLADAAGRLDGGADALLGCFDALEGALDRRFAEHRARRLAEAAAEAERSGAGAE
ncbi:MAG: winged helix-turn-helix transcriptional regulator [Catenulisporales bacterium]|nr:winged helix-turn-helix transcriptional regulator [Catenulisporales bacterium]